MKNAIIFIIMNIFFLLFVFPLYADTIIIASDNWCPISCEPNSDQEGFMVDIAKIVFKKEGHKVEYKNIPWNRTLEMARKGIINGVIGVYIEDCPDFIFPKNELAMIGFNIFVQKGNSWTYNGISSLEEINLAIIADYSYGNEVDSYIKKNKNKSSRLQIMYGDAPFKQNIMKLLMGRVDALIETDAVFWYTANKLKVTNQLKTAGVVTKPKESYIAFSPALPTSKVYAEILSNEIIKLRKSGELEKILIKYGLTDWKK
ncbi:MAG: transporter substrate-binding domain-containing protein [Desulfobacterales bacterium]|nr:transporter substrate-binding domain-containing protein [Desulfobacterales bacterium]MBF0395847.1 transporter substrate-binding domain-containing protein [Desulfobacterales bacterium]